MLSLSKLGDDNEEAQSRTKIENLEDKVSILQTKLGHCPILGADNDMFAAATRPSKNSTKAPTPSWRRGLSSRGRVNVPKVRFKLSFPHLQIFVLSEVLLRIVTWDLYDKNILFIQIFLMINVYVSTVVENYFEHSTICLKIDSFCSYGSPPKIRSRHVEYTLYLLTANPNCQPTIIKQL